MYHTVTTYTLHIEVLSTYSPNGYTTFQWKGQGKRQKIVTVLAFLRDFGCSESWAGLGAADTSIFLSKFIKFLDPPIKTNQEECFIYLCFIIVISPFPDNITIVVRLRLLKKLLDLDIIRLDNMFPLKNISLRFTLNIFELGMEPLGRTTRYLEPQFWALHYGSPLK